MLSWAVKELHIALINRNTESCLCFQSRSAYSIATKLRAICEDEIQGYFGNIAGLDPDYHYKVNHHNKASHTNFFVSQCI